MATASRGTAVFRLPNLRIPFPAVLFSLYLFHPGGECAGELDLSTAEREIATDWFAAYKKYFRTDRPIPCIRALAQGTSSARAEHCGHIPANVAASAQSVAEVMMLLPL